MINNKINIQNPYIWRGMRVGLLGGSFNPPHEGHLHISRIALRMLKLDVIWWLVSPHNPLKKKEDYAPLLNRLAACRRLLAYEPHMLATNIEDHLGTYRSFDTINALRSSFTGTEFIFLMGSDSAINFHKWYRWQQIPDLVSLGVLARPPATLRVKNCPLRMSRRLRHLNLSRAQFVSVQPQSCLWMQQHTLNTLSSSEARNKL